MIKYNKRLDLFKLLRKDHVRFRLRLKLKYEFFFFFFGFFDGFYDFWRFFLIVSVHKRPKIEKRVVPAR